MCNNLDLVSPTCLVCKHSPENCVCYTVVPVTYEPTQESIDKDRIIVLELDVTNLKNDINSIKLDFDRQLKELETKMIDKIMSRTRFVSND